MLSPVCLVTMQIPEASEPIFLEDHEERIILFTEASKSDPDLPFGPLLRWVCSYSLSASPL